MMGAHVVALDAWREHRLETGDAVAEGVGAVHEREHEVARAVAGDDAPGDDAAEGEPRVGGGGGGETHEDRVLHEAGRLRHTWRGVGVRG